MSQPKSKKQPLAEVFGFPTDDLSDRAERYRRLKLCPYNNRVPSCTKDKANDPLGVCSIYYDRNDIVEPITPVRFDFVRIGQLRKMPLISSLATRPRRHLCPK